MEPVSEMKGEKEIQNVSRQIVLKHISALEFFKSDEIFQTGNIYAKWSHPTTLTTNAQA